MKAIILSAGRGTRLSKYTKDLPKGMLNVFDRSIIEHQISIYRKLGITDISIVTGYMSEKIQFGGISYFHNEDFATTNMVYSLSCATEKLNDDVIISYSDILFEPGLIKSMMESTHDFSVMVDTDWKEYWLKRYGKVDFDIESLSFNEQGFVKELGLDVNDVNEIDARYVGLIKFAGKGVTYLKEQMQFGRTNRDVEVIRGKSFNNIYMTDFLQKIINESHALFPVKTKRGWLEFDTNEDYEKVEEWVKDNSLSELLNIQQITDKMA